MTGHEFLEKVLDSYQSAFDITRPYCIQEDHFDAYAAFTVSSAKYVLVKKAELWRADCFEHTFFMHKEDVSQEDLAHFYSHIVSYIEPELVRCGEKCAPKDHMYTYITGVYILDHGVSEEVKRAVKRFHFFKNYRLGLRGYSEARVIVVDMENQKVYGNRAAADVVKGYKRFLKSF